MSEPEPEIVPDFVPAPRFSVQTLMHDLATAHRRIEHLTARMRYWRTQATGYPDSRQQREARGKG